MHLGYDERDGPLGIRRELGYGRASADQVITWPPTPTRNSMPAWARKHAGGDARLLPVQGTQQVPRELIPVLRATGSHPASASRTPGWYRRDVRRPPHLADIEAKADPALDHVGDRRPSVVRAHRLAVKTKPRWKSRRVSDSQAVELTVCRDLRIADRACSAGRPSRCAQNRCSAGGRLNT